MASAPPTTWPRSTGSRTSPCVEKGWIGGGNTGRNTTIIRSNYLFDESAALYDHAVKLWEGLSQDLNYNVMFSPRGVMMLAHTVHDIQVFKRHVHANRCNGVDNEWLDARGRRRRSARRSTSKPTSAIPCSAPRCSGAAERRATTRSPGAMRARPTRSASTSSRTAKSRASGATPPARVEALETTRGVIRTRKVGVSAAGNTSVVMAMAGVRLPLESYPLQALVSEPVKPVFPCVVMSNTIHAYISQSDKGELVIGAGTDAYTSYTQRGALHVNTHTLDAICELFPAFRRMRMMRNWGGIVDVTPDRSPIIGQDAGAGPVRQLRLGHRRLQGDAGRRRMSSPGRSRATSRIRSTRRSRSSAFATAT